jgi:hypothetical protein
MKFPQLNLLFFIALLAFTSCEKEAVAIPEQEPTEDASIGMRCCDEAVAEMVADPRFADYYDGFTNGVFDPLVGILDQVDTAELAAELELFNSCYESGGTFEQCMAQSEILSALLAIINSYDYSLLTTLVAGYDNLAPEELTNVILDAVSQTLEEEGRKLPCFLQFEQDVINATISGAGSSVFTGGLPATIGIVVAIIAARFKFCRCLQSTYGSGC